MLHGILIKFNAMHHHMINLTESSHPHFQAILAHVGHHKCLLILIDTVENPKKNMKIENGSAKK
ncbi:MAG: hypothetical protein WED05_13050 [Candidatus Atabeyarchaeum deiterrae]